MIKFTYRILENIWIVYGLIQFLQAHRPQNTKERGLEHGLECRLERGLERGLERRLERALERGLERRLERGLEHGLECGRFPLSSK